MQLVPLVTQFVDKVRSSWTLVFSTRDSKLTQSVTVDDEKPQIMQAVDEALQQWERARSYFNDVTDPDLIDHAIYEIEAAERKYVYLLRRAQELGCRIEEKYFVQGRA